MADGSPRVRYSSLGRDGACGRVTLAGGEELVVEWDGPGAEPRFSGTPRLIDIHAFRASLLSYVQAKKGQRLAATERLGESPTNEAVDTSSDGSSPGAGPADAAGGAGGLNDEGRVPGRDDAQPGWFTTLKERLRPEPEPLDVLLNRRRKAAREAEDAVIKQAEIHGYGEQETHDRDREAWCSACLNRTTHRALAIPGPWYDAWCCTDCGVITTRCAVPRCPNMSVRGYGRTGRRGVSPPICAEHAHEIPDFENADRRVDDLEHWADLFEYKRVDAGKLLKRGALVAGTAAAALPVTYVAAPAIGGAIGAAVGGYSGAAASSYGLALLGGGSLAAGGLGMAGGQLVIAAVGGGIGGAYGLRVGTAYLGEDKSFGIECVRDGDGPAVVYASGFLTENDDSWTRWRRVIDTAYPDNPVYRVRWGAKELKALATLAGLSGGAHGALGVVTRAALKATTKATTAVLPLQAISGTASLAANPWSTALNRSSLAGATLAAILRRTSSGAGFVLLGHSLGAALMAHAITALAAEEEPTPIVEAHLLGAAHPAAADTASLGRGVRRTVHNYFSRRDRVLSYLYRTASVGGRAAGAAGFDDPQSAVVNVDVSDAVASHSDYVAAVSLRPGAERSG